MRGAGHNGAGFGTADDALVIDLSPMRWVRVDPDARTAQIGGGCQLGDVDHATHAFGLAAPMGIISTTGVGLILGGGVGHLSRKYGLASDHVVSADVVLADGSFVHASENENPDLLWAIRGGGGNFGVVTALTLSLHEQSTVVAGPIIWSLDEAAEVLAWYRDFMPAQPDDLSGFFAFLSIPPGPPFPEELHLQKVAAVDLVLRGDAADADAALAPARAVGHAAARRRRPRFRSRPSRARSTPCIRRATSGTGAATTSPRSRTPRSRSTSSSRRKLPTWKSTMHLYPSDGAAARVAPDASPWAYRDAKWTGVFAGVDPDPANAELIKAWTIDYWEALHPYSMGGSYVNFMMDEGQERVQATYGDNYARLARVKAQYDPDNVFHVNQNIRPA